MLLLKFSAVTSHWSLCEMTLCIQMPDDFIKIKCEAPAGLTMDALKWATIPMV